MWNQTDAKSKLYKLLKIFFDPVRDGVDFPPPHPLSVCWFYNVYNRNKIKQKLKRLR